MPRRSAALTPGGSASTSPRAPAGRRSVRPATGPTRAASRALHVLMVVSEARPFSKTGGLGDVSTSLARALGRLGHVVTLVTPRYGGVASGEPSGTVRAFVAGAWWEAALHAVPLGAGTQALLVDCPSLYDRPGVYAEGGREYGDNPLRFAFLAIAALEWAASQPRAPSILHGHDWPAGLLPVYARRHFPHGVPTVFSIHNLAYQGLMDKGWVTGLGLPWDDFTVDGYEFYDRLSFLKAGIMFANAVTTVSPTYAREIQRPEYGYGFDGIMRLRAGVTVGILNGIDTEEWDPARDPYLPAPFDAMNLAGKREAKRALLTASGLATDEEALARPVVGMVSRMVEQKGLDLIAVLAPQLPWLDATFIIVGTGESRYEDMWRSLAAAVPERVSVHIGFDERRAHLVEGGADLFVMPSRYEPCGLNQMFSMRYGTVPVVRAVGGLADTVRPYDPRNGQGTGFVFSDYDPTALMDALRRALDVFRHQPRIWRRLQTNGMKKDFSWDRSAADYAKLYRQVIRHTRQPS
ncbi:MAG: glycogen synthase GlgA [Acidobacteriota bacterium]